MQPDHEADSAFQEWMASDTVDAQLRPAFRAGWVAQAIACRHVDEVERLTVLVGQHESVASVAMAEVERLRAALDKAAGRLGYLSTVLSVSNKPGNAKSAWEWSEEARRAPEGEGSDGR